MILFLATDPLPAVKFDKLNQAKSTIVKKLDKAQRPLDPNASSSSGVAVTYRKS